MVRLLGQISILALAISFVGSCSTSSYSTRYPAQEVTTSEDNETTYASEEEMNGYQDIVNDTDEIQVAVAQIVLVIAIFTKIALLVGKRQIQKGFSERAALSAVSAIRAGNMKRMTSSICYSVEAAGRARVILGADKKKVVFAGSHEAYSKFISSKNFWKVCRKTHVGQLI